jgi:hypothetical protein
VKNKRIHEDLFIGWQVTKVRSNAGTHQLFVVERKTHVRLQITAVAARADWACVRPQVPCVRTQITARAGWACVRPLLLRATVSAFERTKCVRTHLAGISFFTWCILPFVSHVLMQCPAQHKILKTLKIIRY